MKPVKMRVSRGLGNQGFGRGAFLIVAILLSKVAAAADPTVEALLAKMRRVYSSIKTAHIQTVSYEHQFGAGKMETGILEIHVDTVYKRPGLIHASIQGDGFAKPRIVIAKGTEIRCTSGRLRLRTLPYSFQNIVFDIRGNLETICFWDWERQLSTAPGQNMSHSSFQIFKDVSWNGKKWLVLEEEAGNSFCAYYIDPKTYLIWRTYIRSSDSHREVQDAQISGMTLNQPVDDSEFK